VGQENLKNSGPLVSTPKLSFFRNHPLRLHAEPIHAQA
jgi:hypothetical protein